MRKNFLSLISRSLLISDMSEPPKKTNDEPNDGKSVVPESSLHTPRISSNVVSSTTSSQLREQPNVPDLPPMEEQNKSRDTVTGKPKKPRKLNTLRRQERAINTIIRAIKAFSSGPNRPCRTRIDWPPSGCVHIPLRDPRWDKPADKEPQVIQSKSQEDHNHQIQENQANQDIQEERENRTNE